LGKLVRYADDFVILCRTRAQARQALAQVQKIMGVLRLQIHPDQDATGGIGLGQGWFHLSGMLLADRAIPFQGKVLSVSVARRWAGMSDIRVVIGKLNPVLRGWGAYFRTGNASGKFNTIDSYVRERLLRLLKYRGGQLRWRPGGTSFERRDWSHRRLVQKHGLYQLLGTIRYPGGTHAA
jgi:hypothetical protein